MINKFIKLIKENIQEKKDYNNYKNEVNMNYIN
jgi:hypothetical protein